MNRHVLSGQLEGSASLQDIPETNSRATTTATMERIAVALDLPPSAFVRPNEPLCDKARTLVENAEAAEIFASITDRDARQRGLAYLRWIAEQGSL